MRAALPLLLPLAVAVAGCSAKAQQLGGIPRQGPKPRVVSLSPSTTEIIGSSLDSSLLVGRTQSDDYPSNISNVPVVASVKPDFEKIKGAAPTVVVYDADLYSADDVKRIESMGARPFVFKAHTIKGFEREVYELSALLGSETGVSGYVDRIERERAGAEGERPSNPPNVAVVLGDGSYVAGTESFLADVVRIGGGKLVGPASGKFERMSPEALVAARPDLILLATSKDAAAKDAAALGANPALASSPAVRAKRIKAIDQNVVLRRGGRVDKLIQSVHKAIMLEQEGAK